MVYPALDSPFRLILSGFSSEFSWIPEILEIFDWDLGSLSLFE